MLIIPSRKIAIYSLILGFLPFEYISIGESLSIFKVVIFPLALLGLALDFGKFPKKQALFFWFVVLTQLFSVYSNILYDNVLPAITKSIGIIIFVLYLMSFYSSTSTRRRKIEIKIISYYSFVWIVPLLLYLIADYSEAFDKHRRFKGFHIDPNFLCVYINSSFAAKLIYLRRKEKFYYFLVALIFVDCFTIFLTQSRGGVLSFGIILFGSTFFYYKRVFYALFVGLLISAPFLINKLNTATHYHGNNLTESIFVRLASLDFTESSHEEARLEHIKNFIGIIEKNEHGIFGYTSQRYLDVFNQFPHNLFIDILFECGLLVGGALVIVLLMLMVKNLQRFDDESAVRWILFAALVTMIPLSSFDQKFFWFLFVLLYIFKSKNYVPRS